MACSPQSSIDLDLNLFNGNLCPRVRVTNNGRTEHAMHLVVRRCHFCLGAALVDFVVLGLLSKLGR